MGEGLRECKKGDVVGFVGTYDSLCKLRGDGAPDFPKGPRS